MSARSGTRSARRGSLLSTIDSPCCSEPGRCLTAINAVAKRLDRRLAPYRTSLPAMPLYEIDGFAPWLGPTGLGRALGRPDRRRPSGAARQRLVRRRDPRRQHADHPGRGEQFPGRGDRPFGSRRAADHRRPGDGRPSGHPPRLHGRGRGADRDGRADPQRRGDRRAMHRRRGRVGDGGQDLRAAQPDRRIAGAGGPQLERGAGRDCSSVGRALCGEGGALRRGAAVTCADT